MKITVEKALDIVKNTGPRNPESVKTIETLERLTTQLVEQDRKIVEFYIEAYSNGRIMKLNMTDINGIHHPAGEVSTMAQVRETNNFLTIKLNALKTLKQEKQRLNSEFGRTGRPVVNEYTPPGNETIHELYYEYEEAHRVYTNSTRLIQPDNPLVAEYTMEINSALEENRRMYDLYEWYMSKGDNRLARHVQAILKTELKRAMDYIEDGKTEIRNTLKEYIATIK